MLLGDFEKALAEVGAKKVDITKVLPPKIDWILPQTARGSKVAEEFTVRAEISSPDAGLEEVKLLVNGKAIDADLRVSGNQLTYEKTVELLPGENRLAIFARNGNSGHTSEERVVTVRGVAAPAIGGGRGQDAPAAVDSLDELLKPNLYVLAVGVSEYEDASIPALQYCDDDATAIADFFQKQSGGIFGKTEVKLLVNEEATEDGIQKSLDWLEDNATQKDFVVLFLAAHGLNDEKGNFYLLPTDGDPENLRRTGVAWDDFGEILGNLPSRVLMFLDTCHSGQLGTNLFTLAKAEGTRSRSAGGLKSAFDPSEAIRELTSEENGVVIMAASTGDEESLENDEWGHGAFTFALLEGLGGKADVNGDAVIHLRELDFFISDRVKELTEGVQHPTTVKPRSISRLPGAAVK